MEASVGIDVAINVISTSSLLINEDRKIYLWLEISDSFNNKAVSYSWHLLMYRDKLPVT